MTAWDRSLRLGFPSRCGGSIERPSGKVAVRGRACHQHRRIGFDGRGQRLDVYERASGTGGA